MTERPMCKAGWHNLDEDPHRCAWCGYADAEIREAQHHLPRIAELEAEHDAIRKALGLDVVTKTSRVVEVIGRLERELEELRRSNSE